MDRNLRLNFTASGITGTIRAIRSIGEAARALSLEEIRIRTTTERTVTESVKRESGNRKKATDEEAKHAASVQRSNLAFQKRLARDLVTEHEKAERDRVRSTEKAERERTRIVEREAKARARKEQDAIRETQAAQASAARKFQRDAERAQRDLMFDRKRLYRSIGTGWVEGGAQAGKLVGGLVMRGVQGVSQGLGLSDAWNVGGIVGEHMDVSRGMRAVAIEARGAGEKFKFDEVSAMRRVRAVSKRTGLSQKDLMHAIDVYSEKGSGATAIRDLDSIANQALAMGADTGTIAKLRSQLEQQSKLAGKQLTGSELDQTVAMMHFIGKTGVFRSSDLAKESESMLAAFTAGGIDYRTGMYRYVQFANLARSQKGSAAETRTSINSAFQAIQKKRDAIKNLGVETEYADGSPVDAITVIRDTIMATKGDRTKLSKIFDPSRSGYAINPLITAFSNAYQGYIPGKGEPGNRIEENRVKAGRNAINDLLGKGMADDRLEMQGAELVKEMMKDTQAALDAPGQKIKQSIETIRQSLLSALLPALEKLQAHLPEMVKRFEDAVEFIKRIVKWSTEHPALAVATAGAAVTTIGAAKGAATHVLGGFARYAGDRLAQSQLGGKMGVLTRGAGALMGTISQTGSTPVFITGVAAGVNLGGGLAGDLLSGGVPGVAPAAGVAGKAGILGKMGRFASVAAPMAAVGFGLWLATKVQENPNYDIYRQGKTKANKLEMNQLVELQRERALQRDGMIGILDDVQKLSVAPKTNSATIGSMLSVGSAGGISAAIMAAATGGLFADFASDMSMVGRQAPGRPETQLVEAPTFGPIMENVSRGEDAALSEFETQITKTTDVLADFHSMIGKLNHNASMLKVPVP